MFSNEFMRYLINYQPDGIELKEQNSIKEIDFKTPTKGNPIKVFLTIKSK